LTYSCSQISERPCPREARQGNPLAQQTIDQPLGGIAARLLLRVVDESAMARSRKIPLLAIVNGAVLDRPIAAASGAD